MIFDNSCQIGGQLNGTKDGLVAEQRTLDPLGNWTNFKQDTDTDSDWELDQNRTHNKANEIAAITGEGVEVAHDAAGNMVVAPKPEDWASHYHFIYDPWNRLVEVQTADQSKMVRAYEYDGLNRMIGKWSYDEDAFSLSEWRHYYYSDQWQFLEERVADSYTGSYSGSGIPAMSGWGLSGSGVASTFRFDRQFVWGLRYVNDLVLRDRDTDTNGSLDERLYALQDPNWNVVAIADTSGTILKRFCYSAYGAPEYFTSDFSDSTAGYDWETLYSGYRYDYHADSDVKWHIAGHRILLSHLGKWNRRDPIGYHGSKWNLYQYVGNSPVLFVDFLGLTKVTSPKPFCGATQTADGTYVLDVDDGQTGTVELKRITMDEVEAEKKSLVARLQSFEKMDSCRSRKHEGDFDSKYFAGENQQHQYYLVDDNCPIYADNEINYIGIGLYEAWLGDSLTEAKMIVWLWKVGRWFDVPSEGTMHWLEVGYNNYEKLKSAGDTGSEDTRGDRRCRRCR